MSEGAGLAMSKASPFVFEGDKMKAIWVLLGLALSGCSTSAYYFSDDAAAARAHTKDTDVAVYAGHNIGARYRILGSVVGAGDGNGESAIDEIKKAAAHLGADAVVDLKIAIVQGFWAPGVKATGLAVKK
jgi:hypothetical protein